MGEVQLVGVGKVFGRGVQALAGIDLRIAPGEFLVLLGPSGSGKSTLLRLLAGLETPTSGTILLDGKDARGLAPHQRQVGWMSQRVVLYPHLTLRDHLRFGIPHLPESRLQEMATRLGIDRLLERKPGECSGGEQQRVALARALIRQPRLVLLDEPLSNLEGARRWEFRQQLHLLQRHFRATMIMVTHEQEEALALADRIAVLHRGRIVQVGAPRMLLEEPASIEVARLVGWPPINVIRGGVDESGETVELELGIKFPVPASWSKRPLTKVLLGLRAEQVRVTGRGRSAEAAGVSGKRIPLPVPPSSRWVGVRVAGIDLTGQIEGRLDSEEVQVHLDLGAALLFDASTGLAATSRRGAAQQTDPTGSSPADR